MGGEVGLGLGLPEALALVFQMSPSQDAAGTVCRRSCFQHLA